MQLFNDFAGLQRQENNAFRLSRSSREELGNCSSLFLYIFISIYYKDDIFLCSDPCDLQSQAFSNYRPTKIFFKRHRVGVWFFFSCKVAALFQLG